eukprot:Nk52_evm1s1896 gene=Nk52_evmTU1s1896
MSESRVGVQAVDDGVDDGVVKHHGHETGQGQPSSAGAAEASGGAGVQVGGVDYPDDEGPHLLGVPAPVAAPGFPGPDRPEDQ